LLQNQLDFKIQKFKCLHCKSKSESKWYYLAKGGITQKGFNYYEGFVPDLYLSLCLECYNYTLWLNEKIIYPNYSEAPLPKDDMPLEIKEIFLEAREIINQSPKAASALLRISLKKFIKHLGEKNRNLELALLNLINKGLPEKFYKAFLEVRAIGKNSVKPGVINNRDDIDTALALFNLLNMLVVSTISKQKKVNNLFKKPSKSKKIRKRKKIRKKKTKKPNSIDVIPKPTILYR